MCMYNVDVPLTIKDSGEEREGVEDSGEDSVLATPHRKDSVLATPHRIVVLVLKHLIRAGNIFGVLPFLPFGQDNGGLKQKHPPLVFGHLH